MNDAEAPAAPTPMTRRQAVALVLLTLVSFANYVDRMVLPALAQPIKAEFALSDKQFGLLTGFAFVLLYTFTSLPMARLADQVSRSRVLAVALAFWSLATAACGFVRSYGQLLLARLFVGVGESGCQPIGYALITDYFATGQRATATGWFLVGNSLGVTAGFAIGGWLGQLYGWRTAFIAVGLPGLLLALAMLVFLPAHASTSAATRRVEVAPSLWSTVGTLLGDRRFRWALAANGVYSFMIFGAIAWLPAFFFRSHGLELRVAGTWAGLAIGVGMAAGMLIGGPVADRLFRRSLAAPQLFCMVAALATALAYLVVFEVPDYRWALVATFFASLIGALGSPTNVTTIQALCDPRVRATAAALATLTISMVGIGLAPFVIGALSDAYAPSLGEESLRHALTLSLLVCLPLALLYYRLAILLRP